MNCARDAGPRGPTSTRRQWRVNGRTKIRLLRPAAVEDLPPLHHDPFDRVLVAEVLTEPLRFVTHDGIVAKYSDTIITV